MASSIRTVGNSPARRFALLATLALVLMVPAPATAERRTRVTIEDPEGQQVEHVRIDSRGVVITRERGDTMAWSADSGMAFRADIDLGDVDYSGAGIVRLFSDARVAATDSIDGDVVAVFGDVHVDGLVHGSTVAVLGSVILSPGARVVGDAVAVGGELETPSGSIVTGESVSVGFLPLLTLGLPALPVMIATLVLCWLVILFFGWVLAAIFPERLVRVARTASRRTAVSLALGLLSGPLAIVGAVLLLVTVVGAPIAVLMPFLYIGVLFAGYLSGAYVLGSKLLRRRLGERGALAPIAWGSLLVISFSVIGALLWGGEGPIRTVALFFHLAGVLLSVGLTTIGTGAVLLSRLGGAERGEAPAGPAVQPPIATPPMQGPAPAA